MISFSIPLKAPNTANLREHWADKAKRAKKQRTKARLLCPHWTSGPLLVVTLTRVSTGVADSDGVAASLKNVRDGIADRLRIDDGSPLIDWKYLQEKCKPGEECVKVTIQTLLPPPKTETAQTPNNPRRQEAPVAPGSIWEDTPDRGPGQ